MNNEIDLTVLKDNYMKVIEHHKKYCEGENCNISLFLLRVLAEKAGIKFTDSEKSKLL